MIRRVVQGHDYVPGTWPGGFKLFPDCFAFMQWNKNTLFYSNQKLWIFLLNAVRRTCSAKSTLNKTFCPKTCIRRQTHFYWSQLKFFWLSLSFLFNGISLVQLLSTDPVSTKAANAPLLRFYFSTVTMLFVCSHGACNCRYGEKKGLPRKEMSAVGASIVFADSKVAFRSPVSVTDNWNRHFCWHCAVISSWLDDLLDEDETKRERRLRDFYHPEFLNS